MTRTHTTKSARRYPRRISKQRRRELAQKWLEALELTVTEDRVLELAPWVLHFHPAGPRGQIANQLVREGRTPTARTINEAYADQLGRKPLRPEELAVEAHLLRLTSAETKQLLKFVAKVRRQHKHGPTWHEVAQHMGWSHAHTVDVIRHLGRAQLLTYTWTERSLRIYRRKTRSSPTPIPPSNGFPTPDTSSPEQRTG